MSLLNGKEAIMQELADKYHLDDINTKEEDNVKIAYLNTLVQQNWIMFRQLDEISNKLNK